MTTALASGPVSPPHLDRATVAKRGWYCAACKCGVAPSDVTCEETHVACGRMIADDVAPVGLDCATGTAKEPT